MADRGVRRRIRPLALLCALLAVGGCQAPRQALEDLARQHDRTLVVLAGNPFPLLASQPPAMPDGWLRVYIEGDGRAWLTADQPSSDPTPQQLLLAQLAFVDPSPAVWLARPCQFVSAPACAPRWWTSHRYAPEVVDSLSQALDQLRTQGARRFELVGYSGGAALALLLAARREDVVAVQTLAGNLQPRQWVRWQQLEALSGSLEPLDQPQRLRQLPQRHLYGLRDRVIPPALSASYPQALGAARCVAMQAVPEADHHSGWAAAWAYWRTQPLPCQSAEPRP